MSTPIATYQPNVLESFAGCLNAVVKPFNDLVKKPDGLQELIEFVAKGIFAFLGENVGVKACASFNRLSMTVDGTRTIRDINHAFNGDESDCINKTALFSLFVADVLAACAILSEFKVFDEQAIFGKVAEMTGINTILGHQLSFGVLGTAFVLLGYVAFIIDSANKLYHASSDELGKVGLEALARAVKLVSFTLFFYGAMATTVAGVGCLGAFLAICSEWGVAPKDKGSTSGDDKKSNDIEKGLEDPLKPVTPKRQTSSHSTPPSYPTATPG